MEDSNSQEVVDSFRSQRLCWIITLGFLIVKYHHLIIFDKLFYVAYGEILNN